MWDTIRSLVGRGVTVFLTTQYLEEADQLADRVALLDRGTIVAEGSPKELKSRVSGGHLELQFADAAQLAVAAEALEWSSRDDAALALEVPSDGGVRSLRAVLERLDAVGVDVEDLSIHAPSLDDVFLALTDRTEPNYELEAAR
jgi:ABC-2 type transport system ATP-binding protein